LPVPPGLYASGSEEPGGSGPSEQPVLPHSGAEAQPAFPLAEAAELLNIEHRT